MGANSQPQPDDNHMTIVLEIAGTPRPQPRPRFVRGRVVACADPNAKRWIALVETAAKAVAAIRGMQAGPLSVRVGFYFPTPVKSRHSQPHIHRPDSDNLAKLVLDCLMRSGLIGDDSTVSALQIQKTWGKEGRAIIIIDRDVRQEANPAPPPGWLDN